MLHEDLVTNMHLTLQARVHLHSDCAACLLVAVPYSAAEVSSSPHAVMQGNRTWTLYSAQADYAGASSICAAQGLTLVSVHSEADNAALAGLASKYPKWGAGFAANGTLLTGLRWSAGLSMYSWQDGSAVDWSPEGFNLTSLVQLGKECMVVLADGSWQSVSCTHLPAAFACQRFHGTTQLNVHTTASSLDGSITNDTSSNKSSIACVRSLCPEVSSSCNNTNETVHSNHTSYKISCALGDPLWWATMHPECLADNTTQSLTSYFLSMGGMQDLCANPQADIQHLLDSIGTAGAGVGSCNKGMFVVQGVYGVVVNWTLSIWQSSDAPHAFIKVKATTSSDWEAQLDNAPVRYLYWQSATLPVQASATPPPPSYGLPANYQLTALEDGRCEVSSVRLPLYGGSAEFYVRILHMLDGAYLHVWGRADATGMDTAVAEGRVGPGGWVHSAVKYMQLLPV